MHRDELMQPVFTAMDAFEYPELHDESIPCYNFYRQLSKLMVACGVKDFSWRVGEASRFGTAGAA
jgi:kinetochore protein Nuf2